MRLGIKGKQVLYVTSLVGVFVVVLSVLYLTRLAQVSLSASHEQAQFTKDLIFQHVRGVVVEGADPYEALRRDPGLQKILASSLTDKTLMFAAIVDSQGVLIAKDPGPVIPTLRSGQDLKALRSQSAFSQLGAIYAGQGRNLEVREPLLIGDTEIGSIRIGVSTLLIRGEVEKALGPTLWVALGALGLSVVIAMLSAQLILRPIHVIRSGLTRLGRGESGVRLDLDQDDEFGELGAFFNTVSAQLSADRSQMAGQVAHLESAVDHLEDAVAMVSPTGALLFANPAARALFPKASIGMALGDLMAADHPLLKLFEQTLANRQSQGPISAAFESGERLILGNPVNDAAGVLVGIMLIVRNLEYLSQVQSTIRYSRKLAALGRLSAGVAHEVKNPLNAMMIHLELLRQEFAAMARNADPAPRGGAVATVAATGMRPQTTALQHVEVIAREIRRLDEVVQGFLKFTRPEDLKLQPVHLPALLQEIIPILQPEADRSRVTVSVQCPDALNVNGDPAMLKQAFLNLGLNACQAMPNGGTLRIRGERTRGHRVAIEFADTGIGISQEDVQRIFNLYFTTKASGSGIGLSMVYRTVQMHDGEIEVQSTPGAGTTFRVLLPEA